MYHWSLLKQSQTSSELLAIDQKGCPEELEIDLLDCSEMFVEINLSDCSEMTEQ
jgi:hypothetical protein